MTSRGTQNVKRPRNATATLAFVVAFFVSCAVWGQESKFLTSEPYKTIDGVVGVAITGIEGETPRELAIPTSVRATIDGRTRVVLVVGIGKSAFANQSNLKTIALPPGLLEIGESAFENCHNLTDLAIPRNVRRIYRNAFKNCDKIRKATLLSPNLEIDDGVFSDCDGLRTVYLSENVRIWRDASGQQTAFPPKTKPEYRHYASRDDELSIYRFAPDETGVKIVGTTVSGTALGDYLEIPEYLAPNASASGQMSQTKTLTVRSIGAGAFSQAQGLKTVVLPNENVKLESNALPYDAAVSYIGSNANREEDDFFRNADVVGALKTTPVEGGLSIVGFDDARGSERLDFPSIVDGTPVVEIAPTAFRDDSNLKEVVLPDGVVEIGKQAFENVRNLKEVELPKTLKAVGAYAFSDCEALKSITIPESVDSIGYRAFYNCKSLERVVLRRSLDLIAVGSEAFPPTVQVVVENAVDFAGDASFEYLEKAGVATILKLKNKELDFVVVPSTIDSLPVVKIGIQAFENASELENVALPNTLEEIGAYAFSGCSKLETIDIPKRVTTIPSYGFANCVSLRAAQLPDGATEIGTNAFENCVALKSITIPQSVKTIGYHAFYGCVSLKEIVLSEGVKIGTNAIPETTKRIIRGEESSKSDAPSDDFDPGFDDENDANGKVEAPVVKWIPGVDGAVVVGLNRDRFRGGRLEIPAILGGLPVVKIADAAFSNERSITSVVLSRNIAEIGEEAFINCAFLNEASLPDALTTIGNRAFYGCAALRSIILPDNIALIGRDAFPDKVDARYNPGTATERTYLNLKREASADDKPVESSFENNGGYPDRFVPAFKRFYGNKYARLTLEVLVVFVIVVGATSLLRVGARRREREAIAAAIEREKVARLAALTAARTNPNEARPAGAAKSRSKTPPIANPPRVGGAPGLLEERPTDDSDDDDVSIEYIAVPPPVAPKAAARVIATAPVPKLRDEQIAEAPPAPEPAENADDASNSNLEIGESRNPKPSRSFFEGLFGPKRPTFKTALHRDGAVIIGLEKKVRGALVVPNELEVETERGPVLMPVVRIGERAFTRNAEMTSIVLPDGVEKIGDAAFEGRRALKSARLPSKLRYLAPGAFARCSALEEIDIPNENAFYRAIDGALYTKDGKTLVAYPAGKRVAGFVPQTVIVVVAAYAFSGCDRLISVDFYDGLTTVESGAFFRCKALTDVRLPASVRKIGQGAFYDCPALRSITLPDNVAEIGRDAFPPDVQIYTHPGSLTDRAYRQSLR